MDSRAQLRWTQSDRQRKQPSLYDEYLSREKQLQSPSPSPSSPSLSTQSTREPASLARLTREFAAANTSTTRAVTPPGKTKTKDRDTPALSLVSSKQSTDSQYPPQPESPGSSSVKQREKASAFSIARGVLGRSDSSDATTLKDNLSRITGTSRRPRTKTLDDVSKTQSKSPISTNRLKHGSMHTAIPTHSANDSLSSVTHPALVSPLSVTSFSSSSTAPPHRPVSPISTIASIPDSTSGQLQAANAKRFLHLMKTLCGRMSGNLQYRRGEAWPWQPCYGYIDDEVGSLMCEAEQDSGLHRTLISDLRGCQVKGILDEGTQMPYLDITTPNSGAELQIRLKDRTDFDCWFAALLCWNPVPPKGIHNKMAKPQSPLVANTPLSEDSSKRNSDMSLILKEAPVIKVGPMIYWDSNISYSNATVSRQLGKPQVPRLQSYGSHWWRRVSCTLRENGEMKLYAESGSSVLSVVQLSQLSRCAVQRLDPSVLDNEFCIAIYPQYVSGQAVAASARPIYLSLESRILFEVWFVLLRAFTIPQLYGPKPATLNTDPASTQSQGSPSAINPDMFRMERSLSIRVVEARLPTPAMSSRAKSNHQHAVKQGNWPPSPQQQDAHYVEILLDGESRGKTQIKHEGTSPFWREEFEYLDLPAVLTSASVLLRRRPPDLTTPREQHELRLVHEAYGLSSNGQRQGQSAGFTGISNDQTLGKVEIYLEELEGSKEVEKWWPVFNAYGESVGEVLVKARAEENVILLSKDYEPLSRLLHKFDNELTLQIAQMIPSELRRLSDVLLNIFQVSGKVEDWICSLVEEEIDGVHKETPASRLRYTRRVGPVSDAENAATITASSERELLVRDMNKNATLEANLLFRGNTLLTKSLDSYMRRVGREYLLGSLGPVIRGIFDKDPDCEVDPNRVDSERALEKNWSRLLQATHDVWNAIRTSITNAPAELKVIFRHIRACAEDRYGDFLRSVSYSSVSGFLFLRFFCPAVLNPKLFGLLKDDPKPRARRTFTLIAKSLQGLGNMASFGSKEHWMEPMNAFLSAHRESFKSFIDDMCTLPIPDDNAKPPSSSSSHKPTSYSTPLAIKKRLPLTSREGFPSLPYLIDQAREFAGLVELWLNGTAGKDGSESIAMAIGSEDGDLLAFHTLCSQLNARTQDCLARAERAERPNSSLSFRWEELIDQLQNSAGLGFSRPGSSEEVSGQEPASSATSRTIEQDTPTRNSLDNVAIRAAGEVAARARGARGVPDTSSDLDPTLVEEREDYGPSPESFENDRDGGAASAAASMLQQEISTMSLDRRAGMHFRSSFDMHRVGSYGTSGGNSIISTTISGGPSGQLQTSHTISNFSPREPFSSSVLDRPDRRTIIGSAGVRGGSAHGSHTSGFSNTSESESSAMPFQQKEREREKLKKKEKEERERRLVDFAPLANMVGGLRGRRREKKEREAAME